MVCGGGGGRLVLVGGRGGRDSVGGGIGKYACEKCVDNFNR